MTRCNKPYGFSDTGGFPVTQNNGAQVFAIDNTITIGNKINWEQRLGFDRMGSYSFYRQTLPADPALGPKYGISAGISPTLIQPNTLAGLDAGRVWSGQLRCTFDIGRTCERVCEHGVLSEPHQPVDEHDLLAGQAHAGGGRRL